MVIEKFLPSRPCLVLAQVKNIATDQSKIVCCFLLGSCHRNRYHVVVRYHSMFFGVLSNGLQKMHSKIIGHLLQDSVLSQNYITFEIYNNIIY